MYSILYAMIEGFCGAYWRGFKENTWRVSIMFTLSLYVGGGGVKG